MVSRILLHQFTLATHRLLTILVSMIEVRQIDAHTEQARQNQNAGSFPIKRQFVLTKSLNSIRNGHKQHHEQEIIAHLHMVGRDLQGHKKSRHQSTQQILPPIAKHHTGNGRRNISQGNELPDMSGCYDNEEIGRESPNDGSQSRHPHLEIESTEQNVESEQHHEYIPDISRQVQMIQILNPLQPIRRIIARRHLIGRHTSENGIRPTGTLSCPLQIFLALLTGTDTRHRVVLRKNTPLGHRRTEVSERNNGKNQDCYYIRKDSLDCIHNLNLYYIQGAKIR